MKKTALAIHGGAGTILRGEMTAEIERAYRAGLQNALDAGWEILSKNGAAIDAVEAAVVALEDHPLFNAGRGAVFTHLGTNELDASIMNGKNLQAGAVAFIRNIKNPIKLARLIMENSEHILLAGDGAMEFANQWNVEFAPDEYFFTEHRYRQLLRAMDENVVRLDHADSVNNEKVITNNENQEGNEIQNPKSKIQNPIGTVGAVACDFEGNLAAATSTGGMTNKKFGRVGDTPLVGQGTYADNRTCAVSCTGHGEFFMLASAAFDVSARMKYKNLGLSDAAFETVEYLRAIGGEGGLIAVDASGNVALPFNSEGMYRAFVDSSGAAHIEIYRD